MTPRSARRSAQRPSMPSRAARGGVVVQVQVADRRKGRALAGVAGVVSEPAKEQLSLAAGLTKPTDALRGIPSPGRRL